MALDYLLARERPWRRIVHRRRGGGRCGGGHGGGEFVRGRRRARFGRRIRFGRRVAAGGGEPCRQGIDVERRIECVEGIERAREGRELRQGSRGRLHSCARQAVLLDEGAHLRVGLPKQVGQRRFVRGLGIRRGRRGGRRRGRVAALDGRHRLLRLPLCGLRVEFGRERGELIQIQLGGGLARGQQARDVRFGDAQPGEQRVGLPGKRRRFPFERGQIRRVRCFGELGRCRRVRLRGRCRSARRMFVGVRFFGGERGGHHRRHGRGVGRGRRARAGAPGGRPAEISVGGQRRRGGIFPAGDHAQDVVAVFVVDRGEPAVQDDAACRAGEQPDGFRAHRARVDARRAAGRALDEAARPHARQRAGDDRMLRVQVDELDVLVAAPEPGDPLIARCGMEMLGARARRQVRPPLGQPARVERPEIAHALRMRRRQRAKIGEYPLGGVARIDEPRLACRADACAHRERRAARVLAARRRACVAVDEKFARRLRPALVERRMGAEPLLGDLPERGLRREIAGAVGRVRAQREAGERADRQPVGAFDAQRAAHQRERFGFDDFHDGIRTNARLSRAGSVGRRTSATRCRSA
ncbi:hypothetical protein DM52_1963 [Burkholderia mallei]|nr:hypothetical protein DM52_1963 [Burkholderia mallei]